MHAAFICLVLLLFFVFYLVLDHYTAKIFFQRWPNANKSFWRPAIESFFAPSVTMGLAAGVYYVVYLW